MSDEVLTRIKPVRLRTSMSDRIHLSREARKAGLTVSDFMRSRCGLPLRGGKAVGEEETDPEPQLDPQLVERMAASIYEQRTGRSMHQARREARERLEAPAA